MSLTLQDDTPGALAPATPMNARVRTPAGPGQVIGTSELRGRRDRYQVRLDADGDGLVSAGLDLSAPGYCAAAEITRAGLTFFRADDGAPAQDVLTLAATPEQMDALAEWLADNAARLRAAALTNAQPSFLVLL